MSRWVRINFKKIFGGKKMGEPLKIDKPNKIRKARKRSFSDEE